MTGTKISELPAVGPATGAELIPVVQDGVTRKASLAWVRDISTQTISPYEYGAVGDGVADDAAAWNATIRAALSLNKTIQCDFGHFRFGSGLTIPANAEGLSIILTPEVRMEKNYSNVGSGGFFTCEDITGAVNGTTTPKRIYIRSGNWGTTYTDPQTDGSATVSFTGNIFALYVDDLQMDDVVAHGLGPNGRYISGGGNRWRINNFVGRFGQKLVTGSGGCRPVYGDDIVVYGADIVCADDVLQAVPADSGIFTAKGFGSIAYIGCRGRSFKARFMVAALSDQVGASATMTSSIRRVDYINCVGKGGSRSVVINNISSSGQLGEVNIDLCEIDDSLNDDVITPQAIVVQAKTWAGQPDSLAIGAIRITRTRIKGPQRQVMQVFGDTDAVGEITLDQIISEAPRFDGGACFSFQIGKLYRFLNSTINVTNSLQDGVQFGTSLQAVRRVLIDNLDVIGVADPGGGLFNYGIVFTRTDSALVRGRTRVTPVGASAQVRAVAITANAPRTRIESIDLRDITATTAILNSGPSTTFGDDILTASGAALDDRQASQDIAALVSVSTMDWNGTDALIRVNGTGSARIAVISATRVPATPQTLAIAVAPNTANLTLAARTNFNGGNIYMDADVSLSISQSALLIWDVVNNYWRLLSDSAALPRAKAYLDTRISAFPTNVYNLYPPASSGPTIEHNGGPIQLIGAGGQSNAMNGGAIARVISRYRFPPYPNNLLSLDHPRRGVVQGDDSLGFYNVGTATALTGLQDRDQVAYQCTLNAWAAMEQWRNQGWRAPGTISIGAGEGGEPLNSFLPPTQTGANAKASANYGNLMNQITDAVNVARNQYNQSAEMRIYTMTQGEGRISSPLSAGGYGTALVSMRSTLDADVKARTGQTRDVRMGIVQIAIAKNIYVTASATAALDTAEIIFQQAEVVKNNPSQFFLASPLYPSGLGDPNSNSHPLETERAFIAGPIGEAIAREVYEGQRWQHVDMAGLRAVPGTNQLIAFYHIPTSMRSGLKIDNDRVVSVSVGGFTVITSANLLTRETNTITAVASVTGATRRLRLTTATTVSAAAWPGYLAHGILQDESTTYAFSRGGIYVESNTENAFWKRHSLGLPGGVSTMPQYVRHYAPIQRLPMANIGVRLDQQMSPALASTIAAHADGVWWISANEADTSVNGSSLIGNWFDKRASNLGVSRFFQTAGALQSGFDTTLLETERSAVFLAAAERYEMQGSTFDMTGPWTVGFLMNADVTTATRFIWGKAVSAGSGGIGTGMYLGNSSGNPFVALKHGGSTDIISFVGPREGEPMLLWGSHDGAGRLSIRWNGADVMTGVVTTADISPTVSVGVTVVIGTQWNNGVTFPYIGKIRDSWAYSTDLLTASDRTRLFQVEQYVKDVYQLPLEG